MHAEAQMQSSLFDNSITGGGGIWTLDVSVGNTKRYASWVTRLLAMQKANFFFFFFHLNKNDYKKDSCTLDNPQNLWYQQWSQTDLPLPPPPKKERNKGYISLT